jgi:Rrf2 family protein
MVISQTAEYALRALVYLYGEHGAARTVAQIAETTMVPAGYLAKIMQGLSRARLVKSQRGVHGGFQTTRKPEKLTVLEVVSAVDPIRRFPECPLGIRSHGRTLCPLHRKLDQTAQMVEDAFHAVTLADLLNEPRSPAPRCSFPRLAKKSGK